MNQTEEICRSTLKQKKRIVIKVGSSTLTHESTKNLNLLKMEQLVRTLTDLRNQGKEVILVSSGAIAVGRKAMGLAKNEKNLAEKQACAAVGQARLMMVYQKLFGEYNQIPAQILMTKYTMVHEISRKNAQETFRELLKMGVIPIVNENDTVSTDEIEFGDNDTLSAIVTAFTQADLLLLMSDIDGLYTDDPKKNSHAHWIPFVEQIESGLYQMAKGPGSELGTGGMETKLAAAKIATEAGADMVIANGDNIRNISKIIHGQPIGTLFQANKKNNFDLMNYISENSYGYLMGKEKSNG